MAVFGCRTPLIILNHFVALFDQKKKFRKYMSEPYKRDRKIFQWLSFHVIYLKVFVVTRSKWLWNLQRGQKDENNEHLNQQVFLCYEWQLSEQLPLPNHHCACEL